jgi:predicted membrane channel-forming protein YqfA (hemolysin III family)
VDIVGLLIGLIVLVAVGAIVYWFMTKVQLPQPFQIVIYAVVAIVAILVIVNLAGGFRLAPVR